MPMLAGFGCRAAFPVPSLTRPRMMIRQNAALSSSHPFAATKTTTKTPTALERLGGRFPSSSLTRPTRPSPRKLFTPVRSQASDEKSFLDFIRDAASGKPGPESDKLDSKIRRRAEDAIFSGGNRVTVGDVASTSGLTIFEAETALKALAADSLATLAVSNKGDILYCFPSNFRAAIGFKSLKSRLEAFFAATSETSWYFIRTLYGTALLFSILIIGTAFIVILISSSGSSDRDRGRSSGGGGGGGGGGGLSFSSFRSGSRSYGGDGYLSFYDPYYQRRRAMARYGGGWGGNDLNFVQAVYSFVFGEGDPNVRYEERKWQFVGNYISTLGGVVTAEQLAPCMEVTSEQFFINYEGQKEKEKPLVVDESYVLPALTRFKGYPAVDNEGNIVYVFPELQKTAFKEKLARLKLWFDKENKQSRDFHPNFCMENRYEEPAKEEPWEMTGIWGGQLYSVVALGVANLFGVIWLSNAVTIPANIEALELHNLGWVLGAVPYLQIYGVSFFIIPGVRWVLNQGRNQAIAARNKAKDAASTLLAYASPELVERMQRASEMARVELVTMENAVFRSDKDVDEQPVDVESEAWDRKVEQRASEIDIKQ